MEKNTNTKVENVKYLKITFITVPIITGLDKFLNLLTDWTQYLPINGNLSLPMSASTIMMVVGVIEIGAGLLVIKKTQLGAYIISAWLTVIAFVLIINLNYIDVAARDLVMAIAAFTLARSYNNTNNHGNSN